MKFPYKRIPLDPISSYLGKSILRPIIPVTISFGKRSLRYDALIDSGADFCIVPGEIGEYLGIKVKSGQKQYFGGIQEQKGSVAFIHEITLNVGGFDYKTTIGFSFEIAVQGYGILGQKGFFNIFVVRFDYKTGDIELKERLEIN